MSKSTKRKAGHPFVSGEERLVARTIKVTKEQAKKLSKIKGYNGKLREAIDKL